MKPLYIPFCFILILLGGCNKELSSEDGVPLTAILELNFENQADGQPLQLGAPYQNSFGESFSVSKFKYYISNIALFAGTDDTPLPETYFLVDESQPDSKTIRIPIEPGSYEQLHLLMGVDSARNVSGAQTGALDPVNDMFWTWSTGYIMMKLEGSSPQSTQPNNRLQYHVGGFAGPHSTLRRIETGFFTPVEVRAGQTLSVTLTTELQRWFDGIHVLPIANQAVAMTPGPLSSQFADNAASMVAVTEVTVQ